MEVLRRRHTEEAQAVRYHDAGARVEVDALRLRRVPRHVDGEASGVHVREVRNHGGDGVGRALAVRAVAVHEDPDVQRTISG